MSEAGGGEGGCGEGMMAVAQALGTDVSFGKHGGGVQCHWQWNAKRIGS